MALLKFKRSAVPAKIPSIADLDLGELAINTYDGKVYTKKDDGTQAIVEVGGGSGTVTSVSGTGTVSGLTLTGSVTTAGSLTLGGALSLTSGNVTTALGYTPANKAGDTFTGSVTIPELFVSDNTPTFTSGAFQYHLHQSPHIAYVKQTGGYSWYWRRNSTGTLSGTSEVEDMSLTEDGNLNVRSEIRAPIFRDSDNAAYYVDPAASSNLYSATVNSVLVLPTAAGTNSFFVGTGDGASLSTYNFGLSGWNGMALYNPTGGGAFPNQTSGFIDFRNGFIEMAGSFRAPIFYDTPNTEYFVDPSSTSNLVGLTVNGSAVYRSDWTTRFQSGSDFVDGTLVTTDIPAAASEGNSFVIEITGKSYSATNLPFKVVAQGYLYNNTIINYTGISYGGDFSTYIKVFEEGGVLKFWWPRISYWNSFNVNVMAMDGPTNNTITRNRVTAIGNSTEPTGTKKQQINLVTFLRSTGNAVTATKATNLNQARYANTDFNTLGSTGQFFRAYTNYIPSGGSYNQPPNGSGDYKVIQWGDVEGGDGATAGNWGGQIVQNFYTDQMWFRRSYATTWQAWREFIHDGNVGSFAMRTDASATNSVDIRAPLFYDTPDTQWFLDPSSTSVLNVVRANAIQHVNGTSAITLTDGSYLYLKSPDNGVRLYLGGADPANYYDNDTHYFRNRATSILASLSTSTGVVVGPNASGQYTRFGGDGGATDMATLSSSNGNLHIDAKAANNLYLSWYNTATTFVGGGIAATVFADRDNSAYFINPTDIQSIRTVGDWRSDSGAWTGEFAGKIQYHINNWYFQAAGSWEFRRSDTANAFSVTQAGLATAASSFDAPTFRDSNDTGYYLDPFSTGLAIKVNGNMECYARSAAWAEGYRVRVPTRATWGGIRFTRDEGNSNGNWGIGYTGTDSTDDLTFWGNLSGAEGMRARLTQAGNLTVYGATTANQSYAQIFYDSNDGAYYADPANVSNFYRLSSYIAARDANADWNTGFTNTPAYSYNYHGDLNSGTNAPRAGWWFYESMRHSNASNYWGTQIAWGWEDNANELWQRNVSGGGFSGWVRYLNSGNYNSFCNFATNSVYGGIYYDSNDTSAYVDPAGASFIKGGWQMMNPSASNDCFGGLEMRENGLVAASQSAASYAPRVNFHWGSRAAASLYMDSGGSFVFGGQSDITNNRRAIFCSDLYATGNVTAYYSDDRLKTRIGNIENALDIVSSLNGFRYVDNELAETFGYANNGAQLGVSAQEVQKHLPEIVRGAAFDVDHDDPDHGSKTGEHYLTVDYSRLVPLLIEAIKELRDEVEALRK